MTDAFSLVAPISAPATADKPAWWRAAVERLTREHREARAAALRRRALDRATEAEPVFPMGSRGRR